MLRCIDLTRFSKKDSVPLYKPFNPTDYDTIQTLRFGLYYNQVRVREIKPQAVFQFKFLNESLLKISSLDGSEEVLDCDKICFEYPSSKDQFYMTPVEKRTLFVHHNVSEGTTIQANRIIGFLVE